MAIFAAFAELKGKTKRLLMPAILSLKTELHMDLQKNISTNINTIKCIKKRLQKVSFFQPVIF